MDGYRAAGINRLSFGVQSFDDAMLRRLGRIHSAAEAAAAIAEARKAGFDNVNVDLMYALPGQDLAGAQRDIEQAIALSPNHISHYQLTIEPNTEFAARPRNFPTVMRPGTCRSIASNCWRRPVMRNTRFPRTRNRVRAPGTTSTIGISVITSALAPVHTARFRLRQRHDPAPRQAAHATVLSGKRRVAARHCQ